MQIGYYDMSFDAAVSFQPKYMAMPMPRDDPRSFRPKLTRVLGSVE
jgi:hypothetical protein